MNIAPAASPMRPEVPAMTMPATNSTSGIP